MKRTAVIAVAALALLGVAGLLVSAGCGGSATSDSVATVGGTGITKAEFNELMTEARAHFKTQGVAFPAADSATYKAYKAQIVSYLVQEQVVAQSAGALGISVTDKDVAAQVATLEKTYGGEAKVLTILKGQGMTMALLKKTIKIQRLSQLVAAKVTAGAAVTAAQVREYWQAHAATLRKAKKTATFAKARATIRRTLLTQEQSRLWSAWLAARTSKLGVTYGAGYDPSTLTASPAPSAAASASGS